MFSSLSKDDDIDDEEFFDNQLEAYFEQLIQPEMMRGDTTLQKLSECYAALKLSENLQVNCKKGLLQVGLKFKAQHAQWLLNILSGYICWYS